ncbi:MAG TPA: hypothetical protein VKU36_04895 [Candidatus Babeliales bacterium]|nr:hypothetical protein [Candidatus Babeliales bacterium]
MTIKPFFALIFVTTAFATTIEQTKQNIKAEMLKLDQKIFDLYKQARKQRVSRKHKEIDYFLYVKIDENSSTYKIAEDNFKRCERLNDISCFEMLHEELKEWNENN